MLRRIRGRLTYSNVVASMALFIALGGVSYAAVTLPKNSVGSTQIKQNAVTGSKVKSSSLTGSDVKNSSLTGGDVKNGSLTAVDFSGSVQGAQGTAGTAGAPGAKGETGGRGDRGVPGPVTGDLPSGVTLRGNYAIGAPAGTQSGYVRTGVSFGLRLPSDPTVHKVPAGGPKPPECQGTIYMPEAAPGHLCIYQRDEIGIGTLFVCRQASANNPDENGGSCDDAGRTGATIEAQPTGTSVHAADGSWAVTAP